MDFSSVRRLASIVLFHFSTGCSEETALLWLYITYKAMGYQLFSLTMEHFGISFSNITTLDLSVLLATVFKMSKYMKT